MNNLKSFTLVEVLVASVVVSIILLGVITSSVSLNASARYAASSYFVASTTQTTLNHILNSASFAIGKPTNPGFVGLDQVIDLDAAGANILDAGGASMTYDINGTAPTPTVIPDSLRSGDANTFCIHQNLKLDASYDATNPDANHRWLCYTYSPVTNNIYWCLKPFDVNNLPGSIGYRDNTFGSQPGACAATSTVAGRAAVKPITMLSMSQVPAQQRAIFQVTINNCLDPAGGGSFGSCAANNSNNPFVSKTGSISPAGHSS